MNFTYFSREELEKLPPPEGFSGHGVQWTQYYIASVIFVAYKQAQPNLDLTSLVIEVSEVQKRPAGIHAVGCHDTLYEVFVRVHGYYTQPAIQIYGVQVTPLVGGYHLHKIW